MSGKKNINRERTYFGRYILELRENAGLDPKEVLKKLGLRYRYLLDDLETGRKNPTYPILLKMAHLYNVPLDVILRKAYWPQLILLPLDLLIDLEQLDRLSSEDLIVQIEKGLSESEREELTQFIEDLLCKRIPVNHK